MFRLNALKAQLLRTRNAAYTDADWEAIEPNLAAGSRQGLEGMFVAVAGDVPVTFNAIVYQPLLEYQFCSILGNIIDNGIAITPRFTMVSPLSDILLDTASAIICQKVPYPPHAYRPAADSVLFTVKGYSGNNDAVVRAQAMLPLNMTLSLDANSRVLELSPIESAILSSQIAEEEQGKKNLAHNEPFLKLARVTGMTTEKRTLFAKVKRLEFAFGDKYLSNFSKLEDFHQLSNGILSVEFFTMEPILLQVNLALRTNLDNQWLGNGFQLSMAQLTSIVTLSFGEIHGSISIGSIVQTNEKIHGTTAMSQVITNMQFAIKVFSEIFDLGFVGAMAAMFTRVKEELLPTSSQQYMEMINAFLSAAQNPPLDGINNVGWLLNVAWNTNTNNVSFRKYVQHNATVKEAEQKAFNDGIIAQNVAFKAELKDLHRDKSKPSTNINGTNGKRKAKTLDPPKTNDNKSKFLAALVAHAALEPKDGSVPAGTKPLCRQVALGNVCIGNKAKKCLFNSHDKLDSMTDAYIAWCQKRPTMPKVKNGQNSNT